MDGVLNSTQSAYWFREYRDSDNSWLDYRGDDSKELSMTEKMLCPYACWNLKNILRLYPDVQIVISSTWRRGKTVGRSTEKFNLIFKYHKIFEEDRVIGATPVLNKESGYEIEQWINDNKDKNIEDFVILDDDSNMGPYLKNLHFFKSAVKDGFDFITLEKGDKYL